MEDIRSLAVIAVIALLLGEVGGFTTCPWAGLLGLPCPGCGLTRASWALLHGQLATAHSIHPGVSATLLFLGWLTVAAGGQRIARFAGFLRARALTPWTRRAALGLLVSLLAIWILRFCGYLGGPVPVRSWFG